MRGTPQVQKIKVVMSKVVFSGLLTNMLLETGLGGGGGQISEIRGGVKTGNFQGSRDLTPFYNDSIETPYFGGQKSKLSRENFRGEFPPSTPSCVWCVLTSSIPFSDAWRRAQYGWEFPDEAGLNTTRKHHERTIRADSEISVSNVAASRHIHGVFKRPLTLTLLKKHRDTNGSHIVRYI